MKRYFFGSVLCLFVVFGCKEKETSQPVKTVKITFTKQGELHLIKKGTDSIIQALDIEIADDDFKIQTGLMYRESMEDKQAMLFIFPEEEARSFYMKNTIIGLDIIYIDANKQLVSFQKNAKPFDETSLPSFAPAKYVLEINAGLSDRWGLEVGDRVEFTY